MKRSLCLLALLFLYAVAGQATELTGIKSGDTPGVLKAKTFQGLPLVAQEAIVTVPD